uniref:Uncharacterized protein n=1 Tax=Talaromyces marneffei PM1 TaxID=1077442 RepID=A0A093VCC2_TALMA
MASIQIPDEKATPKELLRYISSIYFRRSLIALQQMCLDTERKTTEEIRQVSREDISDLELKQLMRPREKDKDRTFRNKTIQQVIDNAKVIKTPTQVIDKAKVINTPTFVEIDKAEWTVCVNFYKHDGSRHGPGVVSHKDGTFYSDPFFSWMEEICSFIIWHRPFMGLELLFPTSVFLLMKIFSGKIYKRATQLTLPLEPDHLLVKNFLSLMETEAGGDPTLPNYPAVAEKPIATEKGAVN